MIPYELLILPSHWYFLFGTACILIPIGAAFLAGKKRVSEIGTTGQWIVAAVIIIGVFSCTVPVLRIWVDACAEAGGTLRRVLGPANYDCLDSEGSEIRDYREHLQLP